MKTKRFALCFFIGIFASVSLCAQNEVHGRELCRETASFLSSFGLRTVSDALVSGGQNDFPYNVYVRIPASEKTTVSNGRKRLILAFTMEDAYVHRDFFTPFLQSVKEIKSDSDIILLFSYGDEKIDAGIPQIKGTDIFAKSIETPDDYAAVCVDFDARKKAAIEPGGEGTVSPDWLVLRLIRACDENAIPYTLRGGGLNSLFRLSLIESDERSSFFLTREIPCVSLSLSPDSENALPLLTSFVSTYTAAGTESWDRHYILIPTGTSIVDFDERFIVLCFMGIAFVSLFILCEFSFIADKKNRKNIRRDVVHLWYIIPLTALIASLSFQASQIFTHFLSNVFGIGTLVQFILKVAAAFIIVTILYLFQIRQQGILKKQAYAYVLTLASVVNIFIFAAVDISLFFLFTMEYVVTYLSRPFKRTGSLIALFFLMGIPFLPYVVQIINFGRANAFRTVAYSPFPINVLLAFLFLPFLIQWFRIIARMNERWQNTSLSVFGMRMRNAVLSLAALAMIATLIFTAITYIPDRFDTGDERRSALRSDIRETGENRISCSVSDRTFFGDTSRRIVVRIGKNAVLCSVSLMGASRNPVLYSDSEYVSDTGTNTDTFAIPPYPPETLVFVYTADTSASTTVKVSALYEAGEKNAYVKSTYTFDIPSQKSGGFS